MTTWYQVSEVAVNDCVFVEDTVPQEVCEPQLAAGHEDAAYKTRRIAQLVPHGAPLVWVVVMDSPARRKIR